MYPQCFVFQPQVLRVRLIKTNLLGEMAAVQWNLWNISTSELIIQFLKTIEFEGILLMGGATLNQTVLQTMRKFLSRF